MPDYQNPSRPHGATSREIEVIAKVYRVACQAPDRRAVGPIRDAVELIVDLIEDRGKRRDLDEQWDVTHDGG